MTRAATADELTKLRSSGQWARWKCIIDRPNVLYTARATGAVATADWSISFDGASGTLTDCVADMTLLVGSTSGGWERGIARLRKAPEAGKFYIGADPSIVCQDNDYLTVVNDFTIWAKHPVGSLIDVDVTHTDQLTSYIPNAVWRRVSVIAAGASISLDASLSWAIGSSISAYAWTFTGATSSSNTTTATPSATYNTSGRFRVDLTLTAANGKTSTSYGWVYVLGVNLAAETGVVIEDPEGESEIGWAAQIIAYDRPTIKDRARVVIYAEDWYDNTAGSIGPVSGAENIILTGWIVGETIIREPGYDYVEFTAGGPGVFCGSVACLQSGLADTGLPSDSGAALPAWAKCTSLTIRKALHYLINYRSTIAKVCNVYVEDYATPVHKITSDSENLWGQLQAYANQGILAATPDRYGHIFIMRDARLYALASRAADIPVIMTLTDADWAEEFTAVRRQRGEAAMAEAEGYYYASRKATKVGARSPGYQPAPHGGVENLSELNFASTAERFAIAGMLAGALNAEIESVQGVLPSNNHFIDVAPRQYVNVTQDGDTLNGIPRRLTLRRSEAGSVSLDVDLEPAGGQWPAKAIIYPDEGQPPITPPVEPPAPPPPPEEPPEPEEPGGADAVVVTASDVRVTADLDQASPTWTSIISGGPSTPIDSDLSEVDSKLIVIESAGGTGSVWLCADPTAETPAWSEVWTEADLGTGGAGVAVSFSALCRVRFAPGSSSVVYVLGYGQVDGTYKPFVLISTNGGTTWTESWVNEDLGNPGDLPFTMAVTTPAGVPDGNYSATITTDGVRGGTVAFGGVYYGGAQQWPSITLGLITIDPPTEMTSAKIKLTGTYGTADHVSTDADPGTPPSRPALSNGYFEQHNDGTETAPLSYIFEYLPDWTGDDVLREIWFGRTNFGTIQTPLPRTQGFNYTWEFVEFNGVSIGGISMALDVARTNPNWVYVGTNANIWKSEDGGYTWTAFEESYGASDICIDPQLGGAAYVRRTDGTIALYVNGAYSAQMDTSDTATTPLGLARSMNSGRLYALKAGTALRQRESGSWASPDLDTGLTGARGLHAYLGTGGDKLIYLDNGDIHYSEDSGATIAEKKGGWTGYGSPVNAHLLKASEA